MFLREPYADRPTTHGRLNLSAADIESFLRRALALREQPMLHAVGDATIDGVLDGLERTGGEAWHTIRPRIEHGDLLEPSHYERARRFGVILVQNPSHFMLAPLMKARLGARASRATWIRTAIVSGIPVAIGSDNVLNPYLNIMLASINANNPQEAMTREQAIAAYTAGATYAEYQEAQKGTISRGMLADLAMLSQDIFKVPAEALPATTSVLTMVGRSHRVREVEQDVEERERSNGGGSRSVAQLLAPLHAL
jgi:predicted amidohydrolase YtcJ